MFLHFAFAIHVSFPFTIAFSCLSCVRLRSLDWTSVHEAVEYTAEPPWSGVQTERWGWGSHDDVGFECSRYQFSFQAELLPSSIA